jgi:hypothetical protein
MPRKSVRGTDMSDVLINHVNALLQVSQVLRLERPDKYDLERLHEWLKDKDRGALRLHKPEEEIWGKLSGTDEKTSTLDQVTLIERENGRGIVTALVYLYDLIWGRHRKVIRHFAFFLTRLKGSRKLKELILNEIKHITPNPISDRPRKFPRRSLPPSFQGLRY